MNIKIAYIPLFLLLVNCTKNEKKCEYYKELYDNGQLKVEGCLIRDTIWDGKYTEYYHSGNMRKSVRYVESKREGQELWYWENGKVKAKLNYKNDILSGLQYTYDDYGRPLSKYQFLNGEKVGASVSFYDTGIVKDYTYYSLNGKPIYRITYDSLGKIKSEEGSLVPVINLNSDKFKVGDTLNASIYVINPPSYKVVAYVGYIDNNNAFIKDQPIKVSNGKSKYSKVIKSSEDFQWGVLFEVKDEEDSVKTFINTFKIEVDRINS